MKIKLPDGQVLQHEGGATLKEVLLGHDKALLKTVIGARAGEQRLDLHTPMTAEAEVELITWDAPDAVWIYRHSLSHVMAQAVRRLFPEAQLAIGPAIDVGYYYDFDVDRPFTPEDLEAIEKEMRKIVKENHRFERVEVGRTEARELLAGQTYKLEILDDLEDGERLSFYRDGDFVDLCRGPHMLSTGQVKHFKLLSAAGAYWRGDEERKMLQRIYGTAFASQEALDHHLAMIEEAKKRDHRRLGRELRLFHIDEAVGPGLVLWLPNGAIVREELQRFISAELRKQGYQQVFTPHIGRLDLYRTSGHFPYYRESQYPPLIEHDHLARLADEGCSCSDLANQMKEGQLDGYLLKPMNCPHHIKIYASEAHSYRDLPLRLAEFGTVYRWEQSGEIGGMTRVRGFTQDDAHLFCTEDQVGPELLGCLEIVKVIFSTLGMRDYRVRVGLRDPDSTKYVGAPEKWDRAEESCRQAARTLGVPFTEEPGEAAFYGPKIDFVVKDVVGREWQLGTVQVDYNLPERFDLSYNGADNKAHRPVMIHRAPFGSLERFVGVLIEHFAGAFPPWLSPLQAVVLPIAERHLEFATQVQEQLVAAGVRSRLEAENTLNYRIRQAQVQKTPYMLVAGDREAENGQVALRLRSGEGPGVLPVAAAVGLIADKIATRATEL
ncbi:MAG: threonine--tRNA ligase [Candidatus Latescibacteria bacterium]|nr:threonine--tRNA ligase [Candidatus Latescibacterota bacterium]